MRHLFALLLLTCLSGCANRAVLPNIPSTQVEGSFKLEFYDPARGRRIPVAIYGAGNAPKQLAVISPGWGGKHTAYSFLANALVRKGYVVAAIQHQLTDDPEPATQGDIALLRRPMWQLGAENISQVDLLLRGLGVADTTKPMLLLGHSHGGDISMLFAAEQPERVGAVYSLDNRRMPMPRTARPRICSVRSGDQMADPGVLPNLEEQRRFGMIIVTLADLKHNDMWDGAAPPQKREMLKVLERCVGSV